MSTPQSNNVLVTISASPRVRQIIKRAAVDTNRKIFEVMEEVAEVIRERYQIPAPPLPPRESFSSPLDEAESKEQAVA